MFLVGKEMPVTELVTASLSPEAKDEIESLLVNAVPRLQELEEWLTIDLDDVEDFEDLRHSIDVALADISYDIRAVDKKLRTLTPESTYTGPKTSVSMRAVVARVNRKLQPYSRLIVSRSNGDKKIGTFQVLDGSFITNAFDHVAVLEDYAREIGALKPHETVVA